MTFRRLETVSFIHSAIYLGLLVCAFIAGKPELRGILNSGHARHTAQVLRAKGTFSTWCPKALAGIGRWPPTIADRALVVQMRRKGRDESVARVRLEIGRAHV